MLKTVHGPKASTLNDDWAGPFAFADQCQLAAYAATEWLYDYALDNVETSGTPWADWGEATGILGAYPIVLEDEDSFETSERYLTPEDITPHGMAILEAAVRGEDLAVLFKTWADEIQEATSAA